jgi:formate/nitrite transporter FocA (FNT family)
MSIESDKLFNKIHLLDNFLPYQIIRIVKFQHVIANFHLLSHLHQLSRNTWASLFAKFVLFSVFEYNISGVCFALILSLSSHIQSAYT